MAWLKHFRIVPPAQQGLQSNEAVVRAVTQGDAASQGTASKYSSYLPEVYAGHPNRVQRYFQYDDMDRDSDIAAALDTIADFCTQSEEQSDEPFAVHYFNDDSATETEVKLIKRALNNWTRINQFRQKLWRIFRSAIKNGDAFFLRDPETQEWLWIDHYSVMLVKVDEENGREPSEYVVRGLEYNKQAKFATNRLDSSTVNTSSGSASTFGSRPVSPVGSSQGSPWQMAGAQHDGRRHNGSQQAQQELHCVDAKHVVHLSLSEGLDVNWPFGSSILEPIFKTYKQKELLEDSIIIYRVQRAPERRIFYIDVGSMSPIKAKAHLHQIKTEIHQRRIPNRAGGGQSMVDAAYNPLSIVEDYYFAQSADGKGSKVETLPGGDALGEIGDLTFFTKKMARGLRIPSTYLSLGEDEQQSSYQDGKLGAAMIQEFRFNKYCMRLQGLLAPVFDLEFKKFIRESGVTVDESLFELRFNPPQNFTKYRQIELDAAQANVFGQVSSIPYLSNRFKLRRYLGLTEAELIENETQYKEENPSKIKRATGSTPADTASAGLSSIGIRPDSGMDDFGLDDASLDDGAGLDGAPEAGGEGFGGTADLGGAPAPGPTPGGAPAAGGPLG